MLQLDCCFKLSSATVPQMIIPWGTTPFRQPPGWHEKPCMNATTGFPGDGSVSLRWRVFDGFRDSSPWAMKNHHLGNVLMIFSWWWIPMAANLSKQPQIHWWRPSFPCFDSREWAVHRRSTPPQQDLLRAHQGTPVMNQGPKAGEAAKRGYNGIFVPLYFSSSLRGCGLSKFWGASWIGGQTPGNHEFIFPGTLWGNFTSNFCLRTYGHIISKNW